MAVMKRKSSPSKTKKAPSKSKPKCAEPGLVIIMVGDSLPKHRNPPSRRSKRR